MINKGSRLPLYYQLKSELERFISSGRWPPGTQVPSERELCERYGISRITVRQALSELVVDGLLTREQGKGTFVSQPRIEQRLTALTGFTQDMKARGKRPGSVVLQLSRGRPSAAVARALGLHADDAQVVVLKRMRTANGDSLAIETAYLAADRFGLVLDERLAGKSLYDLLREKCGVIPTHAEQQINATACPAPEARHLGVRPGSPALHITRTTFAQDGRPFEYVESFYRGDKYVFRVDLITESTHGDVPGRHSRAYSNSKSATPRVAERHSQKE